LIMHDEGKNPRIGPSAFSSVRIGIVAWDVQYVVHDVVRKSDDFLL
jgi:hypothetical protein